MSGIPYEPLVEITRGGITESIHFGAVAIVDAEGKLLAHVGDVDSATFLRSSAKPFQSLPFIERGGHEYFNLSPCEVALICSSHSGTDEHVSTVVGIQEKTGVSEAELLCGAHPPYHPETAEKMRQRGEKPSPNRNNCSGKHTGMLAFARLLEQTEGMVTDRIPYIDPSHPVQQEILHTLAEMCDLHPDEIAIGIDGCSAPTFAVPLRSAALAFARLSDPTRLSERRSTACQTIFTAMVSNPDMVGGPDSFDTHIMKAARGHVLCKGGAEGYQGLGIPAGSLGTGSRGIGIAIKVSDGDQGSRISLLKHRPKHTCPVVVLEVLRQLNLLSARELRSLKELGPVFPLQNWRGIEVGQARPCFHLTDES